MIIETGIIRKLGYGFLFAFHSNYGAITQDGFIHIATSGWISVNTEEKKNKHYIQKVKNQ